MEQRSFLQAKEEFRKSLAKLEMMKKSTDIHQLSDIWSEFLTSVSRVFNKLKNATRIGASKGWYDNIENMRKKDELLSYIRHARNCDEHGLDPITNKQRGSIGMGAKDGGALYLDNLSITKDGITIGEKAAKNIQLTFYPAQVLLIPVKDKGRLYHPPTNHLGTEISGSNPILVAELAVKYIDSVLSEAILK